MARIFLCHASEDKPQVRDVYQRLKALGFEPWLDEEEILPGQDWDYEIEKALETSDFVMVFLSERSVDKTGYIQREFRRALYHSEEIPEGQIHTIPVKLDDCEAPRRFHRHQWANLNDDGAFGRIVRALHHGLEQRGLPKPIPVEPLPDTDSSQDSTVEVREEVHAVLSPAPLIEVPETFTNDFGMTFVRIAAGEFWMGSPDSDSQAENDEKPQHRVTISKPFDLGVYPVTQAQWEAVMGTNPSHFKGVPERPVESVSWNDIQDFLQRLNASGDGRTYALPTEAQWEYACRAGSTGIYCFGDDEAQLGDYAWYEANAGNTTHPVGQKQPNDWGLYDMDGNVWEWCQDGERTYASDAVVDPVGPFDTGADRAVRGGNWDLPALFVRAASRHAVDPGSRGSIMGFRCLSSAREPGSGA